MMSARDQLALDSGVARTLGTATVTFGQRTRRSVRTGSVTTTTTYTYEGLNLLSLSASRSDGATWSVSYLYDASGRAYAGVYEGSDASATAFSMVTTDRGDVVELLDASGASFAAYRYDEWGLATETTSAATALAQAIASRQPLRYAGYCFDADEGLYYLSARTYDPVTRQFLSKDPAKADGEESAYQYCGGDPVGKVDPTGLANLDIIHAHYRFASFYPKPEAFKKTITIVGLGWAIRFIVEGSAGSTSCRCHPDMGRPYQLNTSVRATVRVSKKGTGVLWRIVACEATGDTHHRGSDWRSAAAKDSHPYPRVSSSHNSLRGWRFEVYRFGGWRRPS